MTVRTIETIATVTLDGTLTVRVPPDIEPGEHRITVVFDEQPAAEAQVLPLDFPVISVGSWPEDLSLRREDMYDEWGR